LMVYPENMQKNLDSLHGLIYSQRVLHKLIDKGMMREGAYEVVQRNSLKSWETGTHLKDLLQQDSETILTGDELSEAFQPSWYLRYVDEIYSRFNL
jgi:adenylosuccinate lyase